MNTAIITVSLLAMLSFEALAQKRPSLPHIQAPRELTEVGSEYVEGTVTKLSEQEVSHFLPWAQNAQSVLTKAVRDIETMPVDQQVKHLSTVMKSVVRNSAQKNYQMFMRFALNRTLLLVQELMNQSDMNNPGLLENALDLQVKGIDLALQFYESDLAYQQRVKQGKDSVNLEYAEFGTAFGKTMLTSIQNVLDASAQYRLLYKTLEMINWDFSRDALAIEFSDAIVEIYNTLNLLNEQPGNDDNESVNAIKRLNFLLGSVKNVEKTILLRNETTGRQIEEQERQRERRELERQLSTGVAVIVQDQFVLLDGTDNQTIFSACMAKFPKRGIDRILYSYGNRGIKRLYNSSYFWSNAEACALLIKHLASITSVARNDFRIYGSIENKNYAFSGNSLSTILYQCHDFFYQTSGVRSVDDILVGINNQTPSALRNSSTFWTGPYEVCNVLIQKAIELYR